MAGKINSGASSPRGRIALQIKTKLRRRRFRQQRIKTTIKTRKKFKRKKIKKDVDWVW